MNLIKFAVFAILFTLAGCAGMEPAKESSIERVVDVPGHTKDQIYNATKIWIAETFHSAKAVIENDDKEAGRIIGNGRITYPCSGIGCFGKEGWMIGFTMRVDTKEQKFKITFSNITFSMPPSTYVPSGLERPVLQAELDDARPSLIELGTQLRSAIDKEQTKANW